MNIYIKQLIFIIIIIFCYSIKNKVVGCFDPKTVMAAPVSLKVDFYTIKNEEIVDLYIPIEWKISYTGIIHGNYI